MRVEKIDINIKPEIIAEKLSSNNDMIFLDSCKGYASNIGRYSIISYNPRVGVRSRDGITEIIKDGSITEYTDDDPIEIIDNIITKYGYESVPKEYLHLPFLTGFMGFISYDYRNYIEDISIDTYDDMDMWDVYMMYYDKAIIFDGISGDYYVVASGVFDNEDDIFNRIISDISLDIAVCKSFEVDSKTFKSNYEKDEYIKCVKAVKEYIRSGDVYQINMSQRFEVDFIGDSFSYYKKLRNINPSPFSAYIKGVDFSIASSSLERFIKVRGSSIESRPIKGTIPKTDNIKQNMLNMKILKDSKKDRSELLMIVDLVRNDLSKISKIGTVKVPELFSIEEYPTVYHLVSSIEGELKYDISIKNIIHSVFPGGSITGAPKVAAMNVIEKLEKNRRGIYTGSIGYIDIRRNIDLNIVIRTAVIKGKKLYINVGGGIVWDSDESMEYQETLDKGMALFKAFESGGI